MDPKVNIEELSNLSKLEISDIQDHYNDLLEILQFAEKLNELDTLQIDPLISMNTITEPNLLREDLAKTSISTKDALKNAPDSKGSFFTSPKVILN